MRLTSPASPACTLPGDSVLKGRREEPSFSFDMEMSVVVEENHQRSDTTPLSKSSGSIIRIDTISIDLTGAMETHHEVEKCEHFSIRGYVAEMRKKDMGLCSPFAFDSNQNKSDEQANMLPPLHAAKFRWWRCQNCLREIGGTTSTEEVGMVFDCSRIGVVSTGTCSHMQSPSDAATVLLGSQQAPKMDNFEGRKTDVNKGNVNGAGNDVNQEIFNPNCDVPESNRCLIQKRHSDGPGPLGSKSHGLVEFGGPSSRIAAVNIKSCKWINTSAADNYQTGKLISADGGQRIESRSCAIPKFVGKTSEGINFIGGQKAKLPSLDLEENDNLSAENVILAENGCNDLAALDSPSSFLRQKTQKVRLLTELLGSKGDEGNDYIRTEAGPSNREMPTMSTWLDSVSTLHGDQRSFKKHFVDPKGKRKMLQEKELKPLELISPSKPTKKARVCESQDDLSARVDFQSSVRHRIDKNTLPSKNKNKRSEGGGYYQNKTKQVKFSDAERVFASAEGVVSKSAHSVYIKSRMEPYSRNPSSPQQPERKTHLGKKKKKQVGAEHTSLMPQRTSRKDLDMIVTEPERLRYKASCDATARQGPDLSPSSYGVARRTETVAGTDPLLSQLKGTTTEDYHQRKDSMHVGESSGSHKFAPDLFFRKGLLCDLNEKIAADRTSPLREMQNLVSRIEDRSFPRPQHSDFSGIRNRDNTVEVQEQVNDDIPMEIVELLARNQQERCRHEAERHFFFSEKTNDRRDTELIDFPKVHGNRIVKSLQEENSRMTKPKPLFGTGMVMAGQNVGPTTGNPANCFSGNHLNMGKMEGNPSFLGFGAFSRCKEMKSGGIQISDSVSVGNNNPQSCKWKGDNIASKFCPTKISAFEVNNSCQNGSRLSEEAERFRPSMIPTHVPFGLHGPQKHANQSSNFGLNFMKLNTNELGKQNRSFDQQSLRRASSEYPFLQKHREIDLNAKASGPLDLHSNETIPAMQLLSLMDAGMQSNSAFKLEANPKFFTKPFFPCDHHPKVNQDGTSNVLEKPLFPYDHHSKQATGGYNGKNHPSKKACECSPPVPSVGAFGSMFQKEGNLKRGMGFAGQVSSKSEERGKSFMQNRGGKFHKSSSTSQDKQKGVLGASTKCIDFGANYMNGIVFPIRSILQNEICSLNRNPADFSIPEAGNPYMITGKDLKFGKKVSSGGKSGLINVDGRKRQRGMKIIAKNVI